MNKNVFFAIFLIILSVFHTLQTDGQQNDFQFWPSVQVNVEVISNLKFHIEEELRLRENCSQFSRQINDIGASYRFNNFIKAGVFYRIEANWRNADDYAWRNGFYGDVSLRVEPKRFSLNYRLRIQSSKVEFNEKQAFILSGFGHRHKVSAEYNIKGLPLSPFIEGELIMLYSGGKGSEIAGYRARIGVNYAMGKKHEIGIKYGIDQELNTPDPWRAYVIALNYSLNLKLRSVD
jgi:hypothetical protein